MCRHCKDNDNDERKDHVYIYTCALVFEGLKDLVVRDQVRENDGPGMLASWRLLVPQLWEKGHNKYLILAHKLIAGKIKTL